MTPFLKALRFDRPIGTLLLFLPCLWGDLAANNGHVSMMTLVLFLGALWGRSLGCLINDMVDRKKDALVQRTCQRPLANNTLPMEKALMYGAMLCAVGGLPFLCLLTLKAIAFGLVGCLFMVLYPFAKRVTYFPQVVLGVAFNIGVFVGSAEGQAPALLTYLLFLYGFFWTIEYDLIYGYQDIEDDLKAGIKSMSLWCEGWGWPVLVGLSTVRVTLLLCLGYAFYPSWTFFGGTILMGLHAVFINHHLCLKVPASCHKAFLRHAVSGVVLALMLMLG